MVCVAEEVSVKSGPILEGREMLPAEVDVANVFSVVQCPKFFIELFHDWWRRLRSGRWNGTDDQEARSLGLGDGFGDGTMPGEDLFHLGLVRPLPDVFRADADEVDDGLGCVRRDGLNHLVNEALVDLSFVQPLVDDRGRKAAHAWIRRDTFDELVRQVMTRIQVAVAEPVMFDGATFHFLQEKQGDP